MVNAKCTHANDDQAQFPFLGGTQLVPTSSVGAATPVSQTGTGTSGPQPSSTPPVSNSTNYMPSTVAALYQKAQAASCAIQLDTGNFIDTGGGNAHYCGDSSTSPKYVYWMSNMDTDCDGSSLSGPCANDPSHSSQTTFNYQGKPLDAQAIPYVVINDQDSFKPSSFGIQGLAVVGVVCAHVLKWAVFGDTNAASQMGEASIFLAQQCFGGSMSGDNGHEQPDVLYFAFTGSDAVDSSAGLDPNKLAALGNSLLSRLS